MNLPLFISRRYLFARKSHNVINIISTISAVGMAIGTAALIIILSIYNGFDSLVKSSLSSVDPDILVTPATGKVFVPQGKAFDWAYANPKVKTMSSILEDNVFISYGDHQGIAHCKGVDQVYEEESPIRNQVREGTFALHRGDIPMASVGIALAFNMGISPRFVSPIEIYYPHRTGNISLANPAGSVNYIDVIPSSIFSISSKEDNDLIIIPIEQMRELLEYTDEVSSVEIRLADSTKKGLKTVIQGLSERLGPDFVVKDRFQQNESLYKMMRYEKAAIYLILIFVIIIIAFNIFGSLSMLIIEKKGDIETFRSMGATDRLLKRTFVLEGWMISLLGLLGGLVLGVGFALLQQKYGFIKMPGNYIITAYPIILKWIDIAATAVGVAVVGYLIALLPVVNFFRHNSSTVTEELSEER